jgi:histidine triad (HIT) family protein
MSSIFSKIIAGDIPSFKVYEDDMVYAFLDINPMQPGHTLVVPKKEVDQFTDLDDETYIAVMLAAKKIAKAQKKALQSTRICTIVEGYEVPHFHYHLIPTDTAEDFSLQRTSIEPEVMADIAAKISAEL